MADEIFPKSNLPIRKTSDLLPNVFKTDANQKFISGVVDPWTQPGKLDKTVGYVGRRYGKTFNPTDVYLDTDNTLRSRYQLEPGVISKKDGKIENFYDYIDLKNQLRYFGNEINRDDKFTNQDHYTWNPPIDWDKFVNFREYYWIPDGPPPITVFGQSQDIISTYKVNLGVGSTWIFTPDGLTNNPTITLYRGQTYKFQINAPDNGFVIRTAYDTGSLLYNPDLSYIAGQFVVYDSKLWKAKVDIPFSEGSTITLESEDWEYVEDSAVASSLDYNVGLSSNGISQGTITWTVPLNAPDVLFYQSLTDPNRFGRFLIANIESNTKIDVEKEIIGKESYLTSNGVELSNGMICRFGGQVTPSQYAIDSWLVEGVGKSIKLIRWTDLTPPQISNSFPEVLFDNSGFDSEPFDDATSYPLSKDYVTINRASQDLNPWSRYNRWFHRTVLEISNQLSGGSFNASSEYRAKRPIIEFLSDLQLFNHGTTAKKSVDLIDTFTTDVFSEIEGSQGYIVDGEELFQGARLLVVADKDKLANNKIYEVNFINHSTGSSYRQDWSVFNNYRTGETVRYNGQSFSALKSSPSYQATVTQSFSVNNRFRIARNSNIKIDQAVQFTGQLFGNVVPDQIYYVNAVFNNNTYTEFTISLSKRGTSVVLTNGAQGLKSMTVNFTEHPTNTTFWIISRDRRQINLKEVSDSDPLIDECVLVKRGNKNRNLMYHFDGNAWKLSQSKTGLNVSPLFDIYDENQTRFSDQSVYPVSSFAGSKILSYKVGSSPVDSELGFSLSYLNINNIGDISFSFDWGVENFTYEINNREIQKKISTGFYKFNGSNEFGNSWLKYDIKYHQPIIYSVTLESDSNEVKLFPIKWKEAAESSIKKILIYVDGKKYQDSYTRTDETFVFESKISSGSTVTIEIYCDLEPDQGYYELPMGIEKNPLNQDLNSFTLGQVIDHVESGLDLFDNFSGQYPGISNLRDINGYQPYMKRFVKHTGLAAVSLQLLCDKEINIIKSLEFASKSYRDFKNNFLQAARELDFNENIPNFVDEILAYLTKVKNPKDAFIDSDMIGTGAFTSLSYTVEDEGINTFSLSQRFSLQELSRRAVYVYLNGIQLLFEKEYQFDETFGFVSISIDLVEGDSIEIREYVTSAYCFIPPTPTKLGLYKKYTPRKFLDDTYITPINVIQGHDGSIITAFNDYRDELLIELEYRIYNNIKQEYDFEIFDIDKIFGGYYGNSVYNKQEFDSLLAKQFRRWSLDARTDFVVNSYFDSENPFTYTYSLMADPTETQNLPGYWRGVYQWFYDTVRPHQTPWEMLGFSEKPDWWDQQYGSAPYTKNNLLLWEDLASGKIRQGPRTGVHQRYVRPSLMNHIPVDDNGNLVDPLLSSLATNFVLQNSRIDFKFGDIAPVEYAWRSSSEYPFAVCIALCLSRPFEFITENLDKTLLKNNLIGQLISAKTGTFIKVQDIAVPSVEGVQTSGLINYLTDYLRSLGKSVDLITDRIYGLDVNLSTRLSGFVDQSQQKYLLDSKNPSSKVTSIFVPQENYDIIFNVSSPIDVLTYSGIVIEKIDTGFRLYGYDNLDPAFRYFEPYRQFSDPLISVGGVNENFVEWQPGTVFNNGIIARVADKFYRCIRTHTSNDGFEINNWRPLPKLPTVDAITAYKRIKFNSTTVKTLEYGARFSTIQDVVDFICGYEEYLISRGFIFDQYDSELGVNRDWTTSIKEFLFWTRHNWAVGSLISLSPSANDIKAEFLVGVAENFIDRFYDYLIYKSDGSLLLPDQINVNRDFRKISISTVEQTDGIYLLKLYLVLKEHVTIFTDRTVFNDVLYDKTTGYRQERIKSRGFRTVDWDGDYTSPGFVFDNVKIESWQPFVDYNLGDIVNYASYNWTSLMVQRGEASFDDTKWSKLDFKPTKQLISNFDFRANQFLDFYNVDSDGMGQSQRELARHLIGYQERSYLQEIAEDNVTQFQLYQGFIREKGTFNAVDKIFNKLANTNQGSIRLYEDWAFRLGSLGGEDQLYQLEFKMKSQDFEINPQPIEIINGPKSSIKTDQILRINQTDFNYSPQPFTENINPTKKYIGQTQSAGFVRLDQIDLILKSKEDLLDVDINQLVENNHIWFTFDKNSWSVVRFNASSAVIINSLSKDGGIVTLNLNRTPNFTTGDIIGIKDITNLTGFYKVISVVSNTVEIEVDETAPDPEFEGSTISYNLYFLTNSRFSNYQTLDQRQVALLREGSKLWIDDGYSTQDKWQVIQKNKRYSFLSPTNYLITEPRSIGRDVLYLDILKQSIFSAPASGAVFSAIEFKNTLQINQLILPPTGYEVYLNNTFGDSLAVSPDNKWLAVGNPTASGVRNDYVGLYSPTANYNPDDIVLFAGKLWKALEPQNGDGSTIDIDSEKWSSVDVIKGNLQGDYTGPTNQGMIVMYRYTSGQWSPADVILSPRMDTNEYFGSKISISESSGKYYMSVSATGAEEGLGRVYLFVYENGWKILQNNDYKGIYDPIPPLGWTESDPWQYPKNSIVYNQGNYYKSLEDQNGDGSTINPEGRPWEKVDPYRIISHLPQRTAYGDDGSTLAYGINEDSTLSVFSQSELIKKGDSFGSSMAMNRDGSILAIGVPNADEEYFENYKGEWRSYSIYRTGDVVRYFDSLLEKYVYKRLFDPRSNDDPNTDSTEIYTSIGESPSMDPWETVGSTDSSYKPTGKVFVYQRNSLDQYELKQTISSRNLSELNDTGLEQNIATGDQFGYTISLDFNGTTLVVSSPQADINFISKGAAYVFRSTGLDNLEFRLKQKLESFEDYPNERFGSSLSLSGRAERLVVGATNARFQAFAVFDNGETVFDNGKTRVFEDRGNSGQAYVFEKKDQTYILTEKLDGDFEDFESFGNSLSLGSNVILTGSPGYKKLVSAGDFVPGQTYIIKETGNTDWQSIGLPTNQTAYSGTVFTATGVGQGTGSAFVNVNEGKIRLFVNSSANDGWSVIAEEPDMVDLDKIYNISLVDSDNSIELADLDVVDHYKFKILGKADQEITFKTIYDPAVYSVGDESVEVDETIAWTENNVGELWWDISTVKFLNYEQGETAYRSGNWNGQAPYSSIDIYEWVESKYLPSQWFNLADSVAGLAEGISGTPKNPDDTVYSVKVLFNPLTGESTDTKYYYWVKNKTVVPNNPKRRISAIEVQNLIVSPEASGMPFISIIDKNKFLCWNFDSVINSDNVLLNLQYSKGYKTINPVHREYQLLTEGVNSDIPNYKLETKWIDSLVGYDQTNRKVPDESLSDKQKYGVSFRPRQSMFRDRFAVLNAVLDSINDILKTRAFSESISYQNLGLVDPIPDEVLNEYDSVVDKVIDLQNIGTTRTKRAILRPVIVEGAIESIIIDDPGFGYKNVPYIEIIGDGKGATAEISIDNQGRVVSARVILSGRNYTSAVVRIRNFSVLVRNDETVKNYWSIYAWDDIRQVFVRSKVQSFNTPQYWKYIDWYKSGYSSSIRIVKELQYLFEEEIYNFENKDVIRIKEYGNGGWALLEKATDGEILGKYNLIGRESGTIEIIKDDFLQEETIGYDISKTFDDDPYDTQPTLELRNILKAAKEDVFIEDLSDEWNKLFFTSIRYSLLQFDNLDWAFKTSFLNAVHDVGDLIQKPNYRNDNLESYQKYLEEIKPYKSTIREFVSKYNSIDNTNSAMTDFDSPPAYSIASGKVIPVSESFNKFNEYPWKWFADNQGHSIIDIRIYNPGSGYTTPPSVLIDGDGSGATARAFVSNGSVSGIEVLTQGEGYTRSPTIFLIGGNGSNQDVAKASAILGNGKVRSIATTVRFDRTDKSGTYLNFNQEESFIAQGFTATFDLKYAPNIDKRLISVFINGEKVLQDRYKITLYYSDSDTFSLLKGKITFIDIPNAGDSILISYEKNDQYLNAVNRIQKYYNPQVGMRGKELNQLMTGIDFGGVQIQGTTFDVTGGWDALPWFTDNWDSVEASSDFYFVVDGSTTYVDLPFVPAEGELISIYLKRSGSFINRNINTLNDPLVNPIVQVLPEVNEPKLIRIDDPNYDDLSPGNYENPNAMMPSFIGDGINSRVEFMSPNTDMPYIDLEAGDTLVFRSEISDGTVIINDVNIIDTRLSGGSLDAIDNIYQTATGLTPEEIVVDGEKFISPDQVPAPEENVPGQVLEGVSIKVYQGDVSDASAVRVNVYIADGITTVYPINLTVLENKSILVYINKLKLDDSSLNYEINHIDNTVVFTTAPDNGSVIEIIAIGLGGVQLLDYQEFVGDGETDLFLTNAFFDQTANIFVTVNGEQVDAVFYNSKDFTDKENRTIVQIGTKPSVEEKIKIICLGTGLDADSLGLSLIRINSQEIFWDGSTVNLELDNFVNLSRSSSTSSIIVDINDVQLNGVDTKIVYYDGTNNSIIVGTDPVYLTGDITINDIEVYINGIIQESALSYTFSTLNNEVVINQSILSLNDEIKVILKSTGDFSIVNNDLVLAPEIIATMSEGDKISVTWFSEYPSFDIVTDQYVGGKIEYQLKRKPLSDDYVYVYLNGSRLTKNLDYLVNSSLGIVELRAQTSSADTIIIKEFGSNIWNKPSSFEIHKDMLNINHYVRHGDLQVKLARELNYFDDMIEVTDGSKLSDPISNKVPGIILVGKEKIEYFSKNGNILSKLRRGVYGTPIPEKHESGLRLIDVGFKESIPYADKQHKYSFVGDGSTLLVGPLDFVPKKSERTNWYRGEDPETGLPLIPENYGPCDEIEVFVAGQRLMKNSILKFNEEKGSVSPYGDEQVIADFSVDGESVYIRLSKPAPAGIRITVIRKTGKIWYDKGTTTISSGKPLDQNNNPIAKFIFAKTADNPE